MMMQCQSRHPRAQRLFYERIEMDGDYGSRQSHRLGTNLGAEILL